MSGWVNDWNVGECMGEQKLVRERERDSARDRERHWPDILRTVTVLRKSNTIQARVHRRYQTSSRWKNRVEIVQLKCFEETINWHAHWRTDWSAESATKGVMAAERCKNMLHKDHIYVVKRCMTYICPIIITYVCCLQTCTYCFKTYICCLKSFICCWRKYAV